MRFRYQINADVKYICQNAILCTRSLSWCQQKKLHKGCCCLISKKEKPRMSPINIQMMSEMLHKQVFPQSTNSNEDISMVQKHLTKHQLLNIKPTIVKEVDLELPKLLGSTIDEHFRNIAEKQIEEYVQLAHMLTTSQLPPRPQQWTFAKGWTKYDANGQGSSVDFPGEQALVFDIECLIKDGHYPTLATAVSPTHWYSWCSDYLIKDKFKWSDKPLLVDLIPLETKHGANVPAGGEWLKRLVIGHNVGFDRSFVKEQYYIQGTQLRFLDTLSLHIATSGFTNFQRMLFQANKNNSSREIVEKWESNRFRDEKPSSEWMTVGTMNNLSDVFQLHCNGEPLNKETREVFISGSMKDVRTRFQELMLYCARDVEATHEIFIILWKDFTERFPHPVSLAGMLEMGTAFLPVNHNWDKYIQQANGTYRDLQRELKLLLMQLADDACEFLHEDRYKDDIWLWNLDWSVRDFKLKKLQVKKNSKRQTKEKPPAATKEKLAESRTLMAARSESAKDKVEKDEDDDDAAAAEQRIQYVLATEKRLPKISSHMPGYPAWYRDLCARPGDEDWYPGPSLISTQVRVTPRLLRLTWDGYPVHFDSKYGWGYLVPVEHVDKKMLPHSPEDKESELAVLDEENDETKNKLPFPIKTLSEFCRTTFSGQFEQGQGSENFEQCLKNIDERGIDPHELQKHWNHVGVTGSKNAKVRVFHQGDGPYTDIGISGCCFFKIPHKDGKNKRVGNPLAKDYLNKVEDGTLRAFSGASADRALRLSKNCSYWKNNQERIESQMVVWLKRKELPRTITRHSSYEEEGLYGAIIPRIVPAGTVTRRAVEPTWLTASNAYVYRVGSELKAMIQMPPGYHFVGADVDSQELWIASIIGDSHFAKMHGCTAFGWMNLQGKKSDKTDLHSKTADIIGISREHAKVFNYGRIYGAGQKFAEQLLMQFNHRLSKKEAAAKAKKMYAATKGVRNRKTGLWEGGSESHMFNKLEMIARSEAPTTPVLNCRISRALEPKQVNEDFMTSRINWVVQSSAVDYLHLMLVSMKWLFKEFSINGRFCISIHDEVRYLVCSEDRYRAALALQLTNLFTRSMFAYKLGMDDLPQSVAFFSSVDIDTCLRKEVNLDCRTASNPHGLERGYGVYPGEALDIYSLLEKTKGCMFSKRKVQNIKKKTDNEDLSSSRIEIGRLPPDHTAEPVSASVLEVAVTEKAQRTAFEKFVSKTRDDVALSEARVANISL